MAWVHVQDIPGGNAVGATGNGSSQTTGAAPSPVTINNRVILFTWGFSSVVSIASTDITASDNGSTPNTYVQLKFVTVSLGANSSFYAALFRASITHNPSTGNLNITSSNANANSAIVCCAAEFSGGSDSNDTTGSSNSATTATAPSCGNMTTTDSTDLLLAVMADASGSNPATVTTPTNYSSVGVELDGSSFVVGQGIYWIPGATESNNNPTWNNIGGTGWCACQYALSAPAGGVTFPTNPMSLAYGKNVALFGSPTAPALLGGAVGLEEKKSRIIHPGVEWSKRNLRMAA